MISINPKTLTDIARANGSLEAVQSSVTGEGMQDIMLLAVLQLQRFIGSNIEVDTGRTKNSVFTRVTGNGNRVQGLVGTNVRYSPFVRDAGHNRQFMEYAADVEGPNVTMLFGKEVNVRVQRAFNG